MAMRQGSKQLQDINSWLKNGQIRMDAFMSSSQAYSLLESAWKDSLFDD
jgi:hypothetical protein